MSDHMTPGALRFEVLGPLRVWRNEVELEVGPVQQRVVLAVLLLHANRPLPREKLIDAVWGMSAPGRAVNLVQRHAAGLRRALEPDRRARGPSRLLAWTEAGYVLSVPAGSLDLETATGLVRRGRAARAAEDWPAAAEAFHGALRLWRGRLCEGLTSPLLDAERERLEDYRLGVLEERIEADLALGRHTSVVAELAGLVREHPLRERLCAHFMVALYRSGRQAEALAAYRNARAVLAAELGIDPSPELRCLERAVLTADPTLLPPAPQESRPVRVPCLLPGDIAGFIGRAQQLAELDKLTAPDPASTASVICLVSGTPGVGKTALTVHWAHGVRQAFPDGQLYVNLRGYDPEQPMTAGEALARLLAALGLRGQEIPLDVADRSARYRSELAGRRMLVILDNAAGPEQVRPLLPGTPTCPTIVTSRDALPGLVALDGAHRLDLDLLPAEDARALLHQLIGPRVENEPQAAAVLAEQCRRLPLALRLTAELVTAHPHHSLAELASELADRERQLDLLQADEDPSTDVRAVFSWSYQRLPAQAARTFRLLALHPGPDCDTHAAAALIRNTPERAHLLLDRLARAHLIQPTGPHRYTMHELLRAYAAELAATTDPPAARHAALTRLFDHYLATAATATATLHSHRVDERSRPVHSPPASPAPPIGDPDAARAWLDAERANLAAVCARAAGRGWDSHAVDLATTLFRYLDTGGHYADGLIIHTHAQHAARHSGDRNGEAYVLTYLGYVYWRQGCFRRAVGHLSQALDLFRETGDRDGQGSALIYLGLAYWRQGHYERAVDRYRRAADLLRRTGNRYGQAYAHICLGLVYWRQGHCERAADQHRQALDLFEYLDDRDGQGYALTHLGLVYGQQGCYQQAIDRHRQALDLFRWTGNRDGQAYTLSHLGLVHSQQGCYHRAIEQHRQALDLSRQTGYRACEVEALNGLGEALRASGKAAEARAWHTDALDKAVEIGERYEQARAHEGIAATHHTNGDLHAARRHWEDALSLYADLRLPAADTVRAQLAALTNDNADNADNADSTVNTDPANSSGQTAPSVPDPDPRTVHRAPCGEETCAFGPCSL
ncbi:AfsR/SARP family transcriptional regulator [Streptomyces purpurogeneiscleroticus]|uniref:AfsR/SARP family transcriptional regulator n=1 Tax=Streptomyces purpurogeneiscleroticus TaxID=68259 RepID=UPI0021DB6748|nr:BTAD domain-containing putative transcriptional regulator [Streptomyces purpurogeneiscleroticus]